MKGHRPIICIGLALCFLVSDGYGQVESPASLYEQVREANSRGECAKAMSLWAKYKAAMAEEVKKDPQTERKMDDELSKCGQSTRESTTIHARPAGAAGAMIASPIGAAGGAASGATAEVSGSKINGGTAAVAAGAAIAAGIAGVAGGAGNAAAANH
jgi:hypothetical protein